MEGCMLKNKIYLISFLLISCTSIDKPTLNDKYSWLLNKENKKASKWIASQNQKTLESIKGHPEYKKIWNIIRDSREITNQLPSTQSDGKFVYNIRKTSKYPLGFFQRKPIENFARNIGKYEKFFTIDDLSKKEGISLKSYDRNCFYENGQYRRCLFLFSVGGSDKKILREYDLDKKEWIKDGFNLPPLRFKVEWISKNEISLLTKLEDEKHSVQWALKIRHWKRGEHYKKAKVIKSFSESEAVSIHHGKASSKPVGKMYYRVKTTFTNTDFYFIDKNKILVKLPISQKSDLWGEINGNPIFSINDKKDKRFSIGQIIELDLKRFLKTKTAKFRTIYKPEKNEFIAGVYTRGKTVWVKTIKNIRANFFKMNYVSKKWVKKDMNIPKNGFISVYSWSDENHLDHIFFAYRDYLTRPTLYMFKDEKLKKIRRLKSYFNSDKYVSKILYAKSHDGTMVPYSIIMPKNIKYDGSNPVIMYGYGASGSRNDPWYLGYYGQVLLEYGAIYVETHVRGGGELGPEWEYAGKKETKENSVLDFIAIAEDLIKRGISSPDKIGSYGTSWGGILVGASAMKRPDLFKAVNAHMPHLDILNYTEFDNELNWVGELGDPRIQADRKFIKKISPYYLAKPNKRYPTILFTTATNDDRVNPAHARRMAKKLLDFGNNIYFYEAKEGGHRGYVTYDDYADIRTLRWIFFKKELGF